MSKPKRTALVTGASGLAGGYMLAHLLEQGGWDIVAASRRKPRIAGDYRHITVDLLDPADCQAKLGPLTNITHLFYLAITERADPGETMSANTNMFFNLVKTVEAASPALEHVHLSQGTRWYGNHLGPYKTPTREDDPRHMPPNFYYDQQDFLEEFQKGKRWTWSVGRPHAVCGFSTGGPMNLTLAIAVYANICKELGLPLSFPGKPGAYTALYQCTDAALLAKAVEWMAIDPICANQAFNITNSDLSGGRTCGPGLPISSGWNWLRHGTSTLRGPWRTRGRSGKRSSRRTACRNSVTKRLLLGATRTACSLPITISSPIRARPAALVSTNWWTPRRCSFACFQTFGVSGSFHDLPSVLVACARTTSPPAAVAIKAMAGRSRVRCAAFRRSLPQYKPSFKGEIHDCTRRPDYRRLDRYRPCHSLGLAEEGARIVVSGRREEAGLALTQELRALGVEAEFIRADVRHEDDVRGLVGKTVARSGRLDVVVSNAGTEGKPDPVTEQTAESYAATFDTNVLGVLLTMEHEMRSPTVGLSI